MPSPIHNHFALIDQITEEILDLPGDDGQPQRRLAGNQLQALKLSVCNLISAGVRAGVEGTGYSPSIRLAAGAYKQTRYNSLSYRIHVQRAFEGLCALGYLKKTSKGYRNPETGEGQLTRYAATQKLIECMSTAVDNFQDLTVDPAASDVGETIRIQIAKMVKGPTGASIKVRQLIDYSDTPQTEAMRQEMEAINRFLLDHWIDLELTEAEWHVLPSDLKSSADNGLGGLDLTARTLYRVFNDKNWSKGGRLYGGWWQQIPARYRSRITIDGHTTVELDYSSLHPTMLYARKGLKAPADPYSAPLGKQHRDITKQVFNALINAQSTLTRPPRGLPLQEHGLDWLTVRQKVEASFAPLQEYFYSGEGSRLQREDSDMALRIMTDLMKQGIVVLPVHDSFLVQQRHEDDLWRTMGRVFLDGQRGWPRIRPQTKSLASLGPRHGEWVGDLSSANPAIRRLNAHLRLQARQSAIEASTGNNDR